MRKQTDKLVIRPAKIDPPKIAQIETIVYTNHCQVVAAVDEVHMCFGIMDPQPASDSVKYSVDVISGWEHLKRLHDVIGKVIKSHEETFGEIKTNPLDRLTEEAKSLLSRE
jgi:hypothetical protein